MGVCREIVDFNVDQRYTPFNVEFRPEVHEADQSAGSGAEQARVSSPETGAGPGAPEAGRFHAQESRQQRLPDLQMKK